MDSEDAFKLFLDIKFIGVDKINESSANNVSSSARLIRILREFLTAQENFSKAALRVSGGLTTLADKKYDCFQPMLRALAASFNIFSYVQKDFTDSLNNIIKDLTVAFDNNEENPIHIMSPRDINIITNFKNCHTQLEKTRQKYVATSGSSNDNSQIEDRPDKTSKRIRDNYEVSLEKYNNMKPKFINALQEGFNKSKKIQLMQLDMMRKCVKNVGNSLAKLLFDMKESVDILKYFYRSNNKENLFQLWVDANKTVDDLSVDLFSQTPIDCGEFAPNDQILIDINSSPSSRHTPITNNSGGKLKKMFQSRARPSNITNNEPCIIDQDIPDLVNTDKIVNDKKNEEKANVSALKNSKKKLTGLNILKKFQSTSDLTDTSEVNGSVHQDGWQSKSNLNESVMVDEEGFIIRETQIDSEHKLSESSSNSSDRDRLKGIKVNIRPVNNFMVKTASDCEVINAALQLPNPKRENVKINECRRISNLHRCSRLVSDLDKDRFSRRSLSVSELRSAETFLESPASSEEKSSQDNFTIPIACALTEIITSNDGGDTCSIQGQLVLALPIYVKDYLQSPDHILPESIVFDFISDSYAFLSAQILKQYQDIARLELTDSNKCNVKMLKAILVRTAEDESLSNKRNRISFPLLEYLIDIKESRDPFLQCEEKWSQLEDSCIQCNFTISSRYIVENKNVTIKIKLLSGGNIEDVICSNELQSSIYNERYRSITFEKSDCLFSVKVRIKNDKTVRLKLNYEFVFDNCSLVMPSLLIKPINDVKVPFKISLMHYRTISTGNFSQTFDYNIS